MSKPYKGDWIIRSMLFVPGHIEKMARKAAESQADCVVLDLEDAVPEENKAEARAVIKKVLTEGVFKYKTVFVRINPIDTKLTLRDLQGVACEQLHGFIYPMSSTADDIKNFDAQLSLIESEYRLASGHFSIVTLIETPLGILNAKEIVIASKRVVAALFGCEDYLAELQGTHSPMDLSLLAARMQVVHAAKAAGVEAVDTPYINVHDHDGLREFATRARQLGMGGMALMTPKQLPIVHEVYTPNADAIALAKKIKIGAEEAAKEGRGIVIVDGAFVSPPTLKASMKLLKRYESIQSLEAFYAESK